MYNSSSTTPTPPHYYTPQSLAAMALDACGGDVRRAIRFVCHDALEEIEDHSDMDTARLLETVLVLTTK